MTERQTARSLKSVYRVNFTYRDHQPAHKLTLWLHVKQGLSHSTLCTRRQATLHGRRGTRQATLHGRRENKTSYITWQERNKTSHITWQERNKTSYIRQEREQDKPHYMAGESSQPQGCPDTDMHNHYGCRNRKQFQRRQPLWDQRWGSFWLTLVSNTCTAF